MRFVGKGQGLIMTEDEYKALPDEKKGTVSSEWMRRGLHSSFMWNRTIKFGKKVFTEGLNMAIVR